MRKISKPKQFFLHAGPFPALIFFQIWAAAGRTPESFFILALLMFAYCALILVIASRWDRPGYFDWAIAGYFAATCGFLLLWPDGVAGFLGRYAATGIYVCLFGAAFFPPLLGMDPFTYHYAKKSAPPESWSHPIFIKINLIMTYVWAGIFAVGIALSLYPSIIMKTIIPNGLIVFFGFPFNARFPNFYLKQLGLPTLSEQRGMAAAPLPPSARETVSKSEQPPAIKQTTINPEQPFHSRKEKPMKVLALNSSPRTGSVSKTEIMLNHLVQGMREAGAEVEVVELRKKTIKNCIGCFTCWTKTPGVCIHKDDMSQELYPKWTQSDLVVYATPLYHFLMNASMKAFIERTLPMLEPFLVEREGKTSHPLRGKRPKMVFLSVAGFPEMSVFDELSYWVNSVYGKHGTVVAQIYRPMAEALLVPPLKNKATEILEATVQAGREIVESMTVSPETMERITQPFVEDTGPLFAIANLMWKTCISEGITPKEFDEKGLIPRPDSIETFMMIMPMGFKPAAAGDTKAVIQFAFSGDQEGSCHFKIENGKIEALPGLAEKPDLTIQSPFDVWMDIMTGKADGQQMFMAQKYKVHGDLSLLIRMNQLFG
jgi:multimeric flavodoxin WrbA